MSTTSRPDNSSNESVARATTVSGGVSVEAADVNIGGDVAGRDQIKQIDTGGGAYVGRDVVVKGRGKFVGRDDNSVNKYWYVFRSVRQVVVFLLILVVVGAALALGVWWSRQPRRMDGNFNIAVAEFIPKGEADKNASKVSQRIFDILNSQYMLSSFQKVQVEHDNIGPIGDPQAAAALAEQINAQLVIYGTVIWDNGQILVTPQFYVPASLQFDVNEVVNGEQTLAAPITLSETEVASTSSEAFKAIEQNALVLTEFTKALVYLAARTPTDLALARDSIGKAIAAGDRYGDFAGKETLYLFASDIARRQHDFSKAQQQLDEAFRLNANYARAYIAQANLYYDQGNLYQAIEYSQRAKQQPDPPFGSYITEKASLNIGNSCWIQYQYARQNGATSQSGADDYAHCALDNYQQVIAAYTVSGRPDTNLQEMAAWAYYNSGTIYETWSDFQNAGAMYELVLKLTGDPELSQRATTSLKAVEVK